MPSDHDPVARPTKPIGQFLAILAVATLALAVCAGAAGRAAAQPAAAGRAAPAEAAASAPAKEASSPTPASARTAAAADDATLEVANRPVFTFRATLGGATPSVRAARAARRIAEYDEIEPPPKIERVPYEIEGRRGIYLRAGGIVLFAIAEEDLEPGSDLTLAQATERAHAALANAVEALHDQRRLPTILRGVGVALGATLAFALATLLIAKVVNGIRARLQRWSSASQREAASAPEFRLLDRRWASYAGSFLERLLQIGLAAVVALLAFSWVEVVLYSFPTTSPVATRLAGAFKEALWIVGDGVATALPGLVVATLIVLVTRGLVEAIDGFFGNVRAGRVVLPGIHPETAEATRKIVVIATWALAVVAIYPYLPGSGSDVFKGMSILFGAMVTLGSSGIANQMMSGIVLVYSRALRRGDYVIVGETEGVVAEVGTLATKIRTMRNEEVTIPNATLISNPIRNFSKLSGENGTMITTKVTIGYDAPWRTVHELLLRAAARTQGIRAEPAPFVMQRALSDFYVEYELFFYVDRPIERVGVLSALHGQIQDEFNEAGVQIMSPHFLGQPEEPVVVPKSRWGAR